MDIDVYKRQKRTYITETKATVNPAVESRLTGKLNIENMTENGFDVVITDVSGAGKAIQEVLVPVWSDKDGQDDLKWPSASKQADGSYKTHVSISDHKNNHGDYTVHLYYKIDGKLQGVGGTHTSVPVLQDLSHQLTNNGSYSVSYTHLDVYKRQKFTSLLAKVSYFSKLKKK